MVSGWISVISIPYESPRAASQSYLKKINVTPFYLGDIGPRIGSIRSKIEKFEDTEILDFPIFWSDFRFFSNRYRLWKHRYTKLYLRIFGSPVSFRMKECPLFLLGEMTLQKIRILGRTLEINDFSTKKNHHFLRRLPQLLISLFTTVSPLGETVSLPARAGNFLKTVSPFRAPPSGSRGFGVQNSLQQDDNCHWFSGDIFRNVVSSVRLSVIRDTLFRLRARHVPKTRPSGECFMIIRVNSPLSLFCSLLELAWPVSNTSPSPKCLLITSVQQAKGRFVFWFPFCNWEASLFKPSSESFVFRFEFVLFSKLRSCSRYFLQPPCSKSCSSSEGKSKALCFFNEASLQKKRPQRLLNCSAGKGSLCFLVSFLQLRS